MMDDEDSMSTSAQSEILEYTHIIFTVWEWSKEQIRQLENSWRKIERQNDAYDVRISFIPEKQAFEIKASSDNKINDVRKELFELLRNMSDEAKTVFTIPRKADKIKRVPEGVGKPGRPPPLGDDDNVGNIPFLDQKNDEQDDVKRVFQFSHRIGNVDKIMRWNRESYDPDAWKEISTECEVDGELVPYKKKIYITSGETRNIEMAIRKLETLEKIYHREPVKIEVPLVHHPNPAVQFKLSFLKLEGHTYFRKVFKLKVKDPYIIVPAMRDPSNKKWVTPSYAEKDTELVVPGREKNAKLWGQKKNQDNFDSYDWPSIEPPKTQTPWSNSPSTETFSSGQRTDLQASESPERLAPPTREQKNVREEAKKLQMAEARRNRAKKYEGAGDTSNSGTSSAWYVTPEQVEERIHDDECMNVPVKSMTLEKNPNDPQNRLAHGKRLSLRDYNFSQMKQALKSGFEYVRAHKGEVRFSGSLGKVYFTNVHPDISKNLWNFTDLKDVIIGEHRVKPQYHNFLTDSKEFIDKLAELFPFDEETPPEESSFFEICADARNSLGVDPSQVLMHVDCAVSLEKVALPWDRHVDIYWANMNCKYDLAMSLRTRRYMRTDVKPFKEFIKKTAISPDQNVITCENIKDYLEVKSINFKTVTRYKLNKPYIAELTRIEPRTLKDQLHTKKIVGKIDEGKVYWTLEFINWEYEKKFLKDNEFLGTGEVAEWTVDQVLGEEPNMEHMVKYIKAILLLNSRVMNL